MNHFEDLDADLTRAISTLRQSGKTGLAGLLSRSLTELRRFRALPSKTASAIVDGETHLNAAWAMFGQNVGDEAWETISPWLDNLVYRVATEIEQGMDAR